MERVERYEERSILLDHLLPVYFLLLDIPLEIDLRQGSILGVMDEPLNETVCRAARVSKAKTLSPRQGALISKRKYHARFEESWGNNRNWA